MKFAILMFSIISCSFIQSTRDSDIPMEYQGIWKIVRYDEESGNQSLLGDAKFGENHPVEILIVGNRIVIVEKDDFALLVRPKILEIKNGLTLDLQTESPNKLDTSPTYWNLKLENDELVIRLAIDRYEKDPRIDRTAIPGFKCIRQSRHLDGNEKKSERKTETGDRPERKKKEQGKRVKGRQGQLTKSLSQN